MRRSLFPLAGWYVLAVLLLFAPLIQGGSPRLPVAVIQSMILLLAVIWVLQWGWSAPCQSLRVTLFDGLLAFFLFLAMFSFLFAPYQDSAGHALLALGVYSLLYWCLVFNGSRRGLELVLTALVAQGVLQSSLVWYRWGFHDAVRPSGTFYNPNFMASFTVAAALVALGRAVFAAPGRGRERAVMLGAALLAGGGVLLTQSRGGMQALLVGGIVLLAGRSLRLAAGFSLAGLAALFLIPNPFIARLGTLPQMDVYAYSRLAIWRSAFQMMIDHPWFGIGLGQYEYVSPRYAFPVEAHWARYSRVATTPHSEFLHAGAELGFPGLLLLLAAILLLLFAIPPALRRLPARDRGIFFSLFAVMAGLLAHAAVDFPLHIPPLALVLVAAAAGLRLLGAGGPVRIIEFRFRRIYAGALAAMLLFMVFQAVRPVVAFTYFLEGLGAPRNLLAEKWSLEKAPRREMTDEEAIAGIEKAVALDPGNASYHNALGSQYFKAFLRDDGEDEELKKKGLYHGNFARELNPGNYRYAYSLGQAMEGLYRRHGEPRFFSLAMEEYGKVLALAPKNYGMHEHAALLEEEAGNLEAAEERFRASVHLEPNFVRGWYNLGRFLIRQGRLTEGREALMEGMTVPSRVGVKGVTPYEKNLLDFDMPLFEKALGELRQAEEVAE